MNFFQHSFLDANGTLPKERAIQFEACRIIFASDALSNKDCSASQRDGDESWLRDLIMSDSDIMTEALFGPLRTASEGVSTLRIYGRDHLFEECQLEAQLRTFVQKQSHAIVTLSDWQIQQEACAIVHRAEEASHTTLEGFADWVVRTIGANTNWLSAFKIRVGLKIGSESLSASADLAAKSSVELVNCSWKSPPGVASSYASFEAHTGSHITRSLDETLAGAAVSDKYSQSRHSMGPNFFRLFASDLKRWVLATMSPFNPGYHVPSDAEIQHHARWIMYESDDPWNQTAADHPEWLRQFKLDLGIP